MILELHHVQLAMPENREADARLFYVGVLGLVEVKKPAELQSRGGAWFEAGSARIHLGVETPFNAAKKARPALRVSSLDEVICRLNNHRIQFAREIDLPGISRIYVNDPFGNRIELMETNEQVSQ